MRLDIPVVMGFGGGPATSRAGEEAEVEREGHGYSVYCKRGRRETMEDRFSAVVDLEGDPKQVNSWSSAVCLFFSFSFLRLSMTIHQIAM